MTDRLSPVSRSALVHLCEDGAREAVGALERFLDTTEAAVSFDAGAAITFDDLIRSLGGPDGRLVAVSFDLTGAVRGPLALLLPEDDGEALATLLGGGRRTPDTSGALAELGNIAASAFLNGLARRLGSSCVPSVPKVLRGPTKSTAATALATSEGTVFALRARVAGFELHLCAAPEAIVRPLVVAAR